MLSSSSSIPFYFFNDTSTTQIYTLSLHDALPISLQNSATIPRNKLDRSVFHSCQLGKHTWIPFTCSSSCTSAPFELIQDRKSTRLNSSHGYISYAVFCLKKKKLHALPFPVSYITH